jgi:hypothetical protein
LRQPLRERRGAGLRFRIVCGIAHKHADVPHTLRLLRPRDKWPSRHRTAENRDELAPFH